MEKIESTNQEKTGSSSDDEGVNSSFFKGVCGKLKSKVVEFAEETKKIGEDDDPRRIVHSVKVGIAITLVSLLYYLRPLYDGFVGEAGMWAIITVVVVSEFTVGGTLSRGINRGVATLVAGDLGVGAKYLTDLFGSEGEPIALGVLVFVLAAASTYMRFRPNIKKKYDYGVLIFMLTFSLIAISGYRVTNILEMGYHRLITILIGGAVIVLVSVTVFPVWAGRDLHNLVAANIDSLATFFQGYGGHEIRTSPIDDDNDESYLECHTSVLGSKATEESLANFAWWEPCHGKFRFNHPWKHYLKIGDLTRECANHIQTLISIGCCMNSKPQASSEKASSSEFRLKIEPACKILSTELSKAMKELASAMKEMTSPSSSAAEIHIKNSKLIADDLKTVLRKWSSSSKLLDLEEMMPLLVTASVLIDVIECVERISVSLDELSQKARFRQPADSTTTSDRAIVKLDDQHVVIEIKEEDLRDALDNKKPIYIYFT